MPFPYAPSPLVRYQKTLLTFRPAAPAPPQRKALGGEAFADALDRLAAQLVPTVRQQFLAALAGLRDQVVFEQLTSALQAGAVEAVVQAIPWTQLGVQLADVTASLTEALGASGTLAATDAAQQVSASFSFNLTSEPAVQAAQRQAAALVTNITETTREGIRQHVTRAIEQGTPTRAVAQAIQQTLGLTPRQEQAVFTFEDTLRQQGVEGEALTRRVTLYRTAQLERRARLVAQHEIAAAQNLGQQASWDDAVLQGALNPGEWRKRWLTINDDRLEAICEGVPFALVNQQVAINGLFTLGNGGQISSPPAHIGCVTGDTLVTPGGPIAATSKRWYDGEVVILTTANKKQLTCTTNHPILTSHGWIAAGLLGKGDDVICGSREEGIMQSDMDIDDMPTTIEEIAQTNSFCSHALRHVVPMTTKDFHGDGEGSEVAIIDTYGLLRNDISHAAFSKHVIQDALSSRTLSSCLPRERKAAAFFPCLFTSSCSNMSRRSLFLSFLRRHLLPLHCLSFTLRADMMPGLNQSAMDGRTRHTVMLCQSLRRISALIESQQLIKVQRYRFHGFVYNLQTALGWYTGNTIMTHNCRCSMYLEYIA